MGQHSKEGRAEQAGWQIVPGGSHIPVSIAVYCQQHPRHPLCPALDQACLWGLRCCKHMACCPLLQALPHPIGAGPEALSRASAGTGFLTVQPTQPNVHQGVAALSQSNMMLRTVQGAPPTDRAVRESTWYFTVLRPPSRSTLNCSWEEGESMCSGLCGYQLSTDAT